MGNNHKKSTQVHIDIDGDEKIEKEAAVQQRTAESMATHMDTSISSNQHSSIGSGSSSSQNSTERPFMNQRNRRSTSSNYYNSSMVYVESDNNPANVGSNGKKLSVQAPSRPLPSPMNSARMDVDTKIITIPASSLDCPSMHGRGLLLSPTNSPINSPMNSFRNNSVGASSSSFSISNLVKTPPASSRRNSMENNNAMMTTIHSALNFAEMEASILLNEANDDYCVCFFDTTS